MKLRFRTKPLLGHAGLLMICMSLATASLLTGAAKFRPIKKPKYDPTAEVVGLFDGIEQETLGVKLILKDSQQGNLFIENKTDKPLTVKMPKAFAAVQVLKQYGGGGGGFGGGALGGGGGAQTVGGTTSGAGGIGAGTGNLGIGGIGGGLGGSSFPGGVGGGAGFFSIPAEKTVQLKVKTVCLEHGKPEPRPKMTYKVVPVESVSSDPVLQELLPLVGKKSINQQVVQAAAWHLASKMSWRELAAKRIRRIGRPDDLYFHPQHLQGAQQLVAIAEHRAKERKSQGEKEKQDDQAPRSRLRLRAAR